MRALLLALWASAAACAHGAAASYRVTDRPPRLAGRAPWGIFFEVRSLAGTPHATLAAREFKGGLGEASGAGGRMRGAHVRAHVSPQGVSAVLPARGPRAATASRPRIPHRQSQGGVSGTAFSFRIKTLTLPSPSPSRRARTKEIGRAGDGGLYAEALANGDYESQGRLGGGLDAGRDVPDASDFAPWTVAPPAAAIRSGCAAPRATLDGSSAPFSSNPAALRLDLSAGGCSASLRNPGWHGIKVDAKEPYPGPWFALSMYLAVDERMSDADCDDVFVQAQLLCGAPGSGGEVLAHNARFASQASGQGWERVAANMTVDSAASQRCAAGASAATAHLQLTLEARGGGRGGSCIVRLDHVSLTPGDAVRGLFRRDLFDALAALKPGFLRFPGGNYIEGTDEATRWNWKTTVGRREARPGHYNSAWGYWVTDSLGLYELLELADALGAAPLFAVSTGYTLKGKYMPENETATLVQDAVDAVRFANGNATGGDAYGELRATMGRAEPFNLMHFEIGNEEKNMTIYAQRYPLFAAAIRAVEPGATLVASGRWGWPVKGNPCLEGARCDLWDGEGAHHACCLL